MNTGVWYPLLGFLLLAWLILGVAAVVHIPGKAQGQVSWLASAVAALLALVAGFYATQTWISEVVGWVLALHVAVMVVAWLFFIYAVVQFILAVLPDSLASVSVTSGVVTAAFLLPILAVQAAPPGEVGALAVRATTSISTFMVDRTSGWF